MFEHQMEGLLPLARPAEIESCIHCGLSVCRKLLCPLPTPISTQDIGVCRKKIGARTFETCDLLSDDRGLSSLLLHRLLPGELQFLFERRESLQHFVHAQRHVANRIDLREHSR